MLMRKKDILFFILKVGISVALLALLFSVIDIRRTLEEISNVHASVVAVASVLYILATLVATARWRLLLRVQDIHIPYIRLAAYGYSFNFYSVALPGGKIAAEAIRVYQSMRDYPDVSREKLIVSTLTDRLSTVAISFLFAMLFFIVYPNIADGLPWWLPYAGIGSLVLIALIVVMPFERLFGLDEKTDVPVIKSLMTAIGVYGRHPLVICAAILYTVLMNISIAGALFIFARALDVPVTFFTMFLLLSVGMVSAFMPLTLAGIGVREGILAYLIAIVANVPLEIGVSVTLLSLAASFSGVVVGGLIEGHRAFLRSRPL